MMLSQMNQGTVGVMLTKYSLKIDYSDESKHSSKLLMAFTGASQD